jgi:hypothetical protein
MSENIHSRNQIRSAVMHLMLFFFSFFFVGFFVTWLFDFLLLDKTNSLGYYAFNAATLSLLLTTVFKWTTIKTLIRKRKQPKN